MNNILNNFVALIICMYIIYPLNIVLLLDTQNKIAI